MKFTWTAQNDENCWNDKANRVFDTQEECYADMMDHAVNKIKWNVDWQDVIEGQNIIDNGVLKKTNEVGKYAGYIGYDVKFMPHKIVHTSYSGTYTYEIVPVAEDENNPEEEREAAESTRNKYSMRDEVEYNGVIYIVNDYHYDMDADGWVYDLKELEGDGEMLDIPQDEIKIHIEDIPQDKNNIEESKAMQYQQKNKFTKEEEVIYHGNVYIVQDFHYDETSDVLFYDLKERYGVATMTGVPQCSIRRNIILPESIIAEYRIDGKPRMYVYNLSDLNDCEHFFDDEANIERTLVKRDKGLSEEDYYEDMPIGEVKKIVLEAKARLQM